LKHSNKTGNINKHGKEALYYHTKNNNTYCDLCPNLCIIKPNGKGICKNKINIDGKLYTLAFGNPCSAHIDPIEKKPLYHFFPKTEVFSFATGGCNFGCLNCQNYSISQLGADETANYNISPEKIVEACISGKCSSIAYTYTEPTVFYEYTLETAKFAKEKGLKNILISNGYINKEPMEELSAYTDAANIDLKCFDDSIYKKLNKGSLQPVLNTLLTLKKKNIWLEITNLLIPGWTDNFDIIEKMCKWLKENNLDECPLHFSRFSPTYKLNNTISTPLATLEKARKIATDIGLKYVYLGNVYGSEAENTYCHVCSKMLIERKGYRILKNNIIDNRCSFCKEIVAGVWG
jgi:pyruvate formate lyase activating enzyme